MAEGNRFLRALAKVWLYIRGHHPWTRVTALILALLLWVVISSTQNPTRTMRIVVPYERITVLTGEDFAARKLTVADDLAALLERGVAVTIEVPQQSYRRVTEDTLRVEIDLSRQTQAGAATVDIRATTTVGSASVVRVSPSEITLNVDEYRVKMLGVELQLQGTPAEGFVAGPAELGDGGILQVEGPETVVAAVASARAIMSIEGAEETRLASLEIELLDSDGGPVSRAGNLALSMDSLSVAVPIYATREVLVDASGYALTAGEPDADYELLAAEATPNVITVAAPPGQLDAACALIFPPVLIDGLTATVREIVEIVQPTVGFTTPSSFSIVAFIGEKARSRSVSGKTIEAEGLADGLTARFDPGAVDLRIVGPLSVMRDMQSAELRVYADLSGYPAGTYVVPLIATMPEISRCEEVRFESGGVMLSAVSVTITEE